MSEWKHGIAWSADMETGNNAIDSQHKELFRLTSNLVQACEENKGQEILEDTLNFLAEYTVKHFADEEALQVKHSFPDYEKHKQSHDDFKVKVVELIHQYRKDSASVDLIDQVNSIIIRWLLQHIKRDDFKIAAHIRKTTGNA